jgi:hypothetical protein
MAISEHEIKMMNLQKQVRQNQVELGSQAGRQAILTVSSHQAPLG